MVVRVQMGGVSGRSVQSSDSPMFASAGYKCNVEAAVVYGQIKSSIQGSYSVPGKDSACPISV